MSANPQHDEPFWLLGAFGISLRVSQGLDLYGVGLLDLVGCSVTDEDGLASPFDNDLDVCLACQWEEVRVLMMGRGKSYVLAFGDCGEVDLNLGHGQDVGRGGHVDQEICRRREGTYRQRSIPSIAKASDNSFSHLQSPNIFPVSTHPPHHPSLVERGLIKLTLDSSLRPRRR